jgi:hypothetical protein
MADGQQRQTQQLAALRLATLSIERILAVGEVRLEQVEQTVQHGGGGLRGVSTITYSNQFHLQTFSRVWIITRC